ncbi:MAG TPA: hypothetical protein VGD86_06615 [Devosia sp.]
MIEAIADRVASGLAGRKTADAIAAALRDTPDPKVVVTRESDDSPAVIKIVSGTDLEEDMRATWNALMAERGYTVWGEERAKLAEKRAAASIERASLHFELSSILRARESLADNEQSYEKLRNTEPVPATELAGEAKDAAMRLIRQLGYPIGGPYDTTQFDRDGVRYLFHRDGRVETHASDVPTSREQKSQWMDLLDRQISLGRRDPSDLIARRDELSAKIDQLGAILERKPGR